VERFGGSVDGRCLYLVAAEHLVLHLKLVVRIEERDTIEQGREDFVGMGVE